MPNRKIANTSLLIMGLVIIFGLFGLTTVFAASRTGRINLLAPKIDVQATARAIQIDNHRGELQADYQQRMTTLHTQIEQVNQSLEALSQTVATQTSQQNKQLSTLRQQVTTQQQAVDNLQATATSLEETISREETKHQLQLVTLQTEFEHSQAELQAGLQAASAQVTQAEARLATQQAPPLDDIETVPAEEFSTGVSSGNGGGGSSGDHSDSSSDHSDSSDDHNESGSDDSSDDHDEEDDS